MTYSQTIRTELCCDLCTAAFRWNGHLPRAMAERKAREKGWRRDKLGRNVCPVHPKLRGAR